MGVTSKVAALLAISAFACGKVEDNRHLDGGPSDAQGDAAPTGPAHLTVTPVDHMFGPVPLNTASAAVTFTFKNTGGEPATGCSAPVLGGANPAVFTITNDGCGTSNLAGGASCDVQVTANPTNDAMITMTLSRTCAVGDTASTTANAVEANRPMYIFMTSTQSNGNFGGLNGADSKCQVVGTAGTVTGPKNKMWKALLSTRTGTVVNAKDRFVWTGPLFDTKGLIVTRNPSVWPWQNTTVGGMPKWDESGIQGPSYAWSATTIDGVAGNHGDCNAWTDGTNSSGSYAAQPGDYPNPDWLESFSNHCDETIYSLFCISQ